jgi:hypothetical protein
MTKRLIAMLIAICLTGASQAAMIAAPSDRGALFNAVERADVQRQLQAYGINAEQAKARVASLSDQEAAQLAAQIESLPAGGDVGALIGALLVVFLVLLITDILGLTKVFPFTKPIK